MSDDIIITFPGGAYVDELQFKIFPDGGLDVDFVDAQGGHITGRYLNRAEVERLVEQAQQWLKETKPKPPTTPGSVVRVRRFGSDLILTRLNDTGMAHLRADDGAQWVTQYGTFWSDANIVDGLGLGPWEVVRDAGVEQ